MVCLYECACAASLESILMMSVVPVLITEVRFGLNEDMVIGREEGAMRGIGAVVLDDCSFHENANLSEFDRDRCISIAAQDGEV